MKIHKELFAVLLIIPLLLCSCNDTDDVNKIFTGRTWKLTYISQKGSNGLLKPYKFGDVTDENYKKYENGTVFFKIDFEGTQTNDIIAGKLNTSGGVTSTGTWQANGHTNEFAAKISNINYADAKDIYAQKIIYGLKEADSYIGDERNLYLYFNYKSPQQPEAITLCLVFAPAK